MRCSAQSDHGFSVFVGTVFIGVPGLWSDVTRKRLYRNLVGAVFLALGPDIHRAKRCNMAQNIQRLKKYNTPQNLTS